MKSKIKKNKNEIFIEMKTRKLVTYAVMIVLFFVVSANAYAQENNNVENPFALLDSSRFDIVPNNHLVHAAKSIHFGPGKTSKTFKSGKKKKRVAKKKKSSTNDTYYIFLSNDTSGFYFGSLESGDDALYTKYIPINDDNNMCFTLQCRAAELADSLKSNLEKGYMVSVKSDGAETVTYKLFKVDNNIPYPNNTKSAGLFFGVMTFPRTGDNDDMMEFMMEKMETHCSITMMFNNEDNTYTLIYRAR